MRLARQRLGMLCAGLTGFCVGCAPTSSFDRGFVSTELDHRVGSTLPVDVPRQEIDLPPGVLLGDGVDVDEAVAIALWNNAAFHGALSELGIVRGDLVDAGLLPNPVLSLVFPGVRNARSGTLSVPIRILQRRTRVAIAQLDSERIAHALLQNGLGLARDVRIAFAELWFARDRETFIRRNAEVLDEIRQITSLQFEAGGISGLETSRIEIDALAAMAALQDAMRQTVAAQYRFLSLLGLADVEEVLLSPSSAPEAAHLPDLAALIDVALTSRPDVRAAELAVEAAGESVRWERQQTYDFMALLDINQPEGEDLATGPGVNIELPIFNRNQGGMLRASARVEQTALRYLEARRTVVLDVRENYAAYQVAVGASESWQREIIPRTETVMTDTEQARSLGSVSDLTVLQAEQRMLTARIAGVQAQRDLMRASAALAFSVGRKVEGQL